MSPEKIRLVIANFTIVGFHPTLTIFHLCGFLSLPSASTNQRVPHLNQSALACFNITSSTYKYHNICYFFPLPPPWKRFNSAIFNFLLFFWPFFRNPSPWKFFCRRPWLELSNSNR